MSERLRIGLDAHMVGGQETGNETYVRGLVAGFEQAANEVSLLVYYVGRPWTPDSDHVRLQRLVTANPYVRLGAELPLRSLAQRLDVLHMTYAVPVWAAAPLVVTVHDICYATNPEWFSPRDLRVLSAVVPRSIRQAAQVITDSESARRQIIEHYRVPEDKITAIPIGPGLGAMELSTDSARQELAALDLGLERPYVLTVGNLQPRKNLIRLLDAFGSLVEQLGNDIDLVIVGPRRFRAKDITEAAGHMPGRVHFTGYVSDRQLAALYQCSTVFVLPSLYEGFGLPVLEAMAHGVPVVCSDAGALPEVCGDAAILFDPLSPEDIANALGRVLGDAPLRKRLSEAGISRARQFTWKATAERTAAIYRLANDSGPKVGRSSQ